MIGGFHRGIGRAGLVEVSCKRCAGAAFVKNCTVRGHQRYRCKACGCNFTATPERGKPPAMKALAVLLYAMGNASQGMIAPAPRREPRHGLPMAARGRRGR